MAINVMLVRKYCGDLSPMAFHSEAEMIEYFLTHLHFNDAKTQLAWLRELHEKILPGAIEEFKADFELD